MERKIRDRNIHQNSCKECLTRLHSRYIDSHNADHITRLKLGKTHFNAQLHHHNQSDDPYCNYCKVNYNTNVQEDYKHALYHCPSITKIIKGIKATFFRDNSAENFFDITDILISNSNYKSNDYMGQGGQDLINIIWDLFQIKLVNCHTAGTSPIPSLTIKWILHNIKSITKAHPNSELSKLVLKSKMKELLIC